MNTTSVTDQKLTVNYSDEYIIFSDVEIPEGKQHNLKNIHPNSFRDEEINFTFYEKTANDDFDEWHNEHAIC